MLTHVYLSQLPPLCPAYCPAPSFSDVVGVYVKVELRIPMYLRLPQFALTRCSQALSPKWFLPMKSPMRLLQLDFLKTVHPS